MKDKPHLSADLLIKDKYIPRILVIDDEEDINLFFKTCLEDQGFHVTFYSDPLKALSTFKPRYYDLVIIDIRLPKINGFELYEKIRIKDSNIKVCFITAFEEDDDSLKEQFPKLDVKCFIKKPVSSEDLVKHVMSEIISKD